MPGRTGSVPGAAGRVAYARRGTGRPVILLHPLALAGDVWGGFADRLAADFDVVAMDARGHGASEWNDEPVTVADLAEDVVALCAGLGLTSVDIIGMSMGGSTALAVAAARPELVRKMVLADTTAWYGPDAVTTWDERADRILSGSRDDLIPFQTDRWFTEAFRRTEPAAVRAVVEVFLRTHSPVHAAACRALGAMDQRADLNRIRAGTLVLVGEEDYATPPGMAETIATGVARGQLRVLAGLRHLSLIERPELATLATEHFRTGD
jgi:3-oxoadipate enol-lactonase